MISIRFAATPDLVLSSTLANLALLHRSDADIGLPAPRGVSKATPQAKSKEKEPAVLTPEQRLARATKLYDDAVKGMISQVRVRCDGRRRFAPHFAHRFHYLAGPHSKLGAE